jgi:hypothetical protein
MWVTCCYQKNEHREWKKELWCGNLMKKEMGIALRCQKTGCEDGRWMILPQIHVISRLWY